MSNSSGEAPSIADYAIIGDCRTAALVARDATVDWLCLPDFSSPSVFAGVLDRERGGQFVLQPNAPFETRRRYVDGSAVLETEFITEKGRARVRDCLTILDGISPMRPERELLRIVEGLEGTVDFAVTIDLRPDYASRAVRPERRGSLAWVWRWNSSIAVLRSDCAFEEKGDVLVGTLTATPGSRSVISLSYTRADVALYVPLGAEAVGRMERTRGWWRGWSAQARYAGPYPQAVSTSAMVLQLLTFATSGAIIAAPTASLPEQPGGARNWDYRYCWLRDSGLTARAFVSLGYVDEARAYSNWLLHATRLTRPELRVLYDVYGRNRLPERELAYLSGYADSRPVRIGNGAFGQLQLDVYGQTVLAAESVANAGVALDGEDCRMLHDFGKTVCRRWREPDCGIWEIRGAPRHFTLSKVMCWVALDRLLAMDRRGAIRLGAGLRAEFSAVRTAIEAIVETHGYNPRFGCYTSELDGHVVDASLLLLSSVGYRPAGDPRIRGTYARIWETLAQGRLLRRYRPDFTLDGQSDGEGAFGICNFWAVETLARRGDAGPARDMFEHLLGYANDLGLFAEEIDPRSGDMLGNFPQAFTHVGLINAAIALAEAERGVSMTAGFFQQLGFLALWSLIATVAMTTLLQASLGLGWSRMSLPFLLGAFFTDDRRRALTLGFALYTLGGWAFGFLYYALFASVNLYTWWFGALAGCLHGFLLVVFVLPLLPVIHPRMASDYHGATLRRQLEPPGFFALNYGGGTPLVTIVAQTLYGAVLGGFVELHRLGL